MKSAVAIRHVGFEDLGAFEPAIARAGYALHYWDIGDQELWTLEPTKTDLLVVLGGPIGAYEDDSYPFLSEEVSILQQRLEAGRPTMGICLGAQLIARAAGARVYPSGSKEIGFAPIALTEAGRRALHPSRRIRSPCTGMATHSICRPARPIWPRRSCVETRPSPSDRT